MSEVSQVNEVDEVDKEVTPCPSQSLSDWLGQTPEGECRSCLLPPVIQWYQDELREKGQAELAQELERQAETGEDMAVAELMDSIKDRVEPELATRLRDFDCNLQSYADDVGEDDPSAEG